MSVNCLPETALEDALLKVIPLSKLLEGDSGTTANLLAACQDVGFFYLDLRGLSSTFGLIYELFAASEELFKLPIEEKLKFGTENFGPSKIYGYKPAGLCNGPIEGKRDGFESYMIPDIALFNLDENMPFIGPELLLTKKPLLQQCVTDLRAIGLKVLSCLSEAMRMNDGLSFQESHRNGVASTSAVGLLKYLPYNISQENVGHMAHTDAGSIAIVLSQAGGLQVLMPETEAWCYVAPRPGHAIVNVGESLTFLSKGVLRSCLHRVVPHPDTLKMTKYSIVYFLRPEMEVSFNDREGREWKSLAWHNRKFAIFRAPLSEQREGYVLTGRKDYVGLWEPPASGVLQTT